MRDNFCFLDVDSFQQGLYYMFVEDKMLGKINFTRKNIVLGKFKDRKINVGWFGDGDDMGVKIEWFFFLELLGSENLEFYYLCFERKRYEEKIRWCYQNKKVI